MNKKYKIVMLEGTINSPIGTLFMQTEGDSKGNLFKSNLPAIPCNTQHLYILSDEEIKKGDYWMYIDAQENRMLPIKGYGFDDFDKKIIASTDKSLGLPSIPEKYIQHYIEEFNKGNKIEEIELEELSLKGLGEFLVIQNNEVCPVIPNLHSDNGKR